MSEAHAQDVSAQLEEFNHECFDNAGEFEPTDGCYEYAESIGIEIDNLNESMDKGCVLSDLYEDYSCKGPSAPSSSSVSEQEEVSEQAYTPLTQQGTPAPADWRSHVVPLKLAASPKSAATASKPSSITEATIPTALKPSAYKVHEPRDTGRSQGQVVDKEHRDKAHAAATKVQCKLQAAEKAKKAASKKR